MKHCEKKLVLFLCKFLYLKLNAFVINYVRGNVQVVKVGKHAYIVFHINLKNITVNQLDWPLSTLCLIPARGSQTAWTPGTTEFTDTGCVILPGEFNNTIFFKKII